MQVSIGDTFMSSTKTWVDIGDLTSGVAKFRFPQGSRGKLLFIRIHESSLNTRFSFYGMSVYAEPIII